MMFPHAVKRLERAGVRGCLDQDSGCSMLVEVLDCLCRCGARRSPRIEELAADYHSQKTNKGGPASRELSPRELDVAMRPVKVRSAKLVADEIGVSVETVCSHRKNVFRKAGVHSVAELEKWMRCLGFLRAAEE